MNTTTETIASEYGEINVSYKWEKSAPHYEECHGMHDVGSLTETEITGVEIVIAGEGFDLLKLIEQLPQKRKDNVLEHIISLLNYEA